jgi:IS30 family transposase
MQAPLHHERRLQIAELLHAGLTISEIAAQLGTRRKVVSWHIGADRRKSARIGSNCNNSANAARVRSFDTIDAFTRKYKQVKISKRCKSGVR